MRALANRRALNPRLVKRNVTYSLVEVSELFGVHLNTVRNWQSEGLITIDNRRPILIHGSDLFTFLNQKRSRKKQKCGPDELFCFKCRVPRRPRSGHVWVMVHSQLIARLVGHCGVCDTLMFKAISVRRIEEHAQFFEFLSTRPTHMEACDAPALNCDLKEEKKS